MVRRRHGGVNSNPIAKSDRGRCHQARTRSPQRGLPSRQCRKQRRAGIRGAIVLPPMALVAHLLDPSLQALTTHGPSVASGCHRQLAAEYPSIQATAVSACAVAAAAEAIATSASVAGRIKMLTSPRTQSVRTLTRAHAASYVPALLNCITVLSRTPTQKFTPLQCMRRSMESCPSWLMPLHRIDHEQ